MQLSFPLQKVLGLGTSTPRLRLRVGLDIRMGIRWGLDYRGNKMEHFFGKLGLYRGVESSECISLVPVFLRIGKPLA